MNLNIEQRCVNNGFIIRLLKSCFNCNSVKIRQNFNKIKFKSKQKRGVFLMGILKKIWDMLPEGRPICVPKPEAWGVKQEEDKERDNNLKKKDDVEKVKK